MPGTYTVTLNHTQAKNSSFLYGTVNSTLSGYDKYCKFWNWYDLREAGDNPVAWEDTKTSATYAKKWVPEASTGICQTNKSNLSSLNIAVVQSQTTESATVQVLEINPKASMYSVTRPVTGYSPLSLQITPRTTTPGSFPIDRLDWDFGNGLPIKTVTRYSSPDTTLFTFTCAISNDITDPRNYDALCTYSRKLNTYPVFYPSITAYSSSTGSYDTCSLTVGPVSLSSISGQAHLLKVRNSPYGKLYGIQAQNYVTFVTTQTANSDNNTILTTPSNVIKNSFGTTMRYFGNKGTGYPPISAIVC